MYGVEWSERSKRDLQGLEGQLIKRITDKVEGIKGIPCHFLGRLTDSSEWKLRVGDYRIFIDIDESKKKLGILHIEHRKKAYKK